MASLSPKKIGSRIRRLRSERGLSQDEIGKVLGLHRQSVSLIEKGRRELTAIELDELARFLQITYDQILAPEIKIPSRKKETEITMRFQPDKLRQLLLTLLEYVGGRANVGETVLYKLLYFCDFNHYEKTGRSITGMTYRRLQFGPVPQLNQFAPIIEKMVDKKQLEKIIHEYFGKPQTRYIPLCDPNEGVLDDIEKQTICEIANGRLGSMNATQIEEYVHGDIPWEATAHQEPISYKLVHWRTEPYSIKTEAEMLHRAQNAGFEDIAKKIGPMSDEEISYYDSLPNLT